MKTEFRSYSRPEPVEGFSRVTPHGGGGAGRVLSRPHPMKLKNLSALLVLTASPFALFATPETDRKIEDAAKEEAKKVEEASKEAAKD